MSSYNHVMDRKGKPLTGGLQTFNFPDWGGGSLDSACMLVIHTRSHSYRTLFPMAVKFLELLHGFSTRGIKAHFIVLEIRSSL